MPVERLRVRNVERFEFQLDDSGQSDLGYYNWGYRFRRW
jgi:hypothetical protein